MMFLSTCFVDVNLKKYVETLEKNNFSSMVLVKDINTGRFNVTVNGDIDVKEAMEFVTGKVSGVSDTIPRLPLPLSSLVNQPNLVNTTFSSLLNTFMGKRQNLGQVKFCKL